jgi:magnesium chelatase family protein
VAAAREAQIERCAEAAEVVLNSALDGDALTRAATPDEPGRALLAQATETLRLTARGYVRVLRVARTVADLDGADGVRRRHVAEALSFRRMAAPAQDALAATRGRG